MKLAQVQALTTGTQVKAPRTGAGAITPNVFCEGTDPPPCDGSPPYSFGLATRARHQHRWFYCGAAVVQVVSNYSRGYTSTSTCGGEGCASGTNYKDQHYISTNWTKTDLNGQTYVGDLVYGLNQASSLPSGFVYAYWTNMAWTNFHNGVKIDTYTWRMPLAARVHPRAPGSTYYLTSWAGAQAGDYGHYITLRGYSGSTQSSALAYYNDSSGGVDEHTGGGILGSTGSFSDKSYTVWKTMTLRTSNGLYYLIW